MNHLDSGSLFFYIVKSFFFKESVMAAIFVTVLLPVCLTFGFIAIGWLIQRSAMLSALKKFEAWKNKEKKSDVSAG